MDRQLQVKQLSRGQPAELIRWTTWRNRSSVGRQLQIKQLGRRQPAGLIRRRYFRLDMMQLLSSCQPLLGRCVLRSMHSILAVRELCRVHCSEDLLVRRLPRCFLHGLQVAVDDPGEDAVSV